MDGFFDPEFARLTVSNLNKDEMKLWQAVASAVSLFLAVACVVVLRFL